MDEPIMLTVKHMKWCPHDMTLVACARHIIIELSFTLRTVIHGGRCSLHVVAEMNDEIMKNLPHSTFLPFMMPWDAKDLMSCGLWIRILVTQCRQKSLYSHSSVSGWAKLTLLGIYVNTWICGCHGIHLSAPSVGATLIIITVLIAQSCG